jgi:anti-sigma B factor antagonist
VGSSDSSIGLELWISVADARAGGSTVTVLGDLDAATAQRLRESLGEALERGGDIEIDLRGCGFVDSSGIAAIVWAAWQLKDTERQLYLLGAQERVRGILELAGIAGHAAIVIEDPSEDSD